jgi:Zn-dependent peptidase ImmA (M78 family)/transcriptional regulator with XRE-family HTH domain
MNEFNPEMLILARESRGLTQADLAGAVSVQQGTISKIESGTLGPSPEVVERFANKLDYPRELFFQSDRIYGFNSTVFFHRKRQALPEKLLRKLHAQMNLIRMRTARLLRSTEIMSDCRFQRVDPAEYKNSAETVARLVRSTWLIPPGPIRNITRAIEDAGGIVVMMDFETRQIDAISEWVQPFPPIFLVNSNSEITGDRLRLTLTHEIGHAIMHQFPNPKMEDEANAFAAEFLMPAREIKASLYGLTFAKLMDLKAHWKVSMAALVQRGADLKTISMDQKKYMFINLGRRGWRLREPEHTDIAVERPELFDGLIKAHLLELQYAPDQLALRVMLMNEPEFRNQYLEPGKLRLVG